MGNRSAAVKGDELFREKAQAPAGASSGRGATRKGDEIRFPDTIECARLGSLRWAMHERNLDSLRRAPLAYALHGGFTTLNGNGNRRVTHVRAIRPFVGLEQDARMGEGARQPYHY